MVLIGVGMQTSLLRQSWQRGRGWWGSRRGPIKLTKFHFQEPLFFGGSRNKESGELNCWWLGTTAQEVREENKWSSEEGCLEFTSLDTGWPWRSMMSLASRGMKCKLSQSQRRVPGYVCEEERPFIETIEMTLKKQGCGQHSTLGCRKSIGFKAFLIEPLLLSLLLPQLWDAPYQDFAFYWCHTRAQALVLLLPGNIFSGKLWKASVCSLSCPGPAT